jgi:predicted dehydrogenase
MARPDFRWGLVGPGRIAHRFAEAAQRLPSCALVAVSGRDPARAAAFAGRWTVAGRPAVAVAAALPEMLQRGDVEAVYVATPHAFHGDAVRACLDAGVPVLCEKPLVPCAAQARPLLALARERGVFLMEALWTRFLPVYDEVARWLQQGVIGEVRAVQSSFAFHLPFRPHDRCFDPAQAGGALLDIGIYNLALTRWVLEQAQGRCPGLRSVHAEAVLTPGGVDQRLTAQLHFEGGASAQMFCAFDSHADNGLRIRGERGHIVLPVAFWQATRAELHLAGAAVEFVERPFEINGFEGEISEAMRCVRAGEVESTRMPHAESLALVETMDLIRRQVGVRYPFEDDGA